MQRLEGGYSAPLVLIGTVKLSTILRHTDRGFQTASWYQTADLHPQEVELYANGGRFQFMLNGTVVEDFFISSFAGNTTGQTYDRKKNTGKPCSHYFDGYTYNLAQFFEDGDFELTLADGVELEDEYKILSEGTRYEHEARFTRIMVEPSIVPNRNRSI